MARYLVPVVVFAIFVPIFMFGLQKDPTALPSPFIGKLAPEFSLPTLKDPAQTLGSIDYAGDTVLINVWATWCVGCRQEHDYLMQLAARNEIPIYGINWRDRRDDALEWLSALGDPYVASAFDADGKVGIDWGVYGAPETFLVSADGIVLHKHLGPLNEAIWQRDFVPLLDATRDAS